MKASLTPALSDPGIATLNERIREPAGVGESASDPSPTRSRVGISPGMSALLAAGVAHDPVRSASVRSRWICRK